MTRGFLVAWALSSCAAGLFGGEASVRLRVQPMPIPRPALKYQLLPELAELKPGNPAQNYVKCFMEQHSFFYSTNAVAKRLGYQTMALADLPLKDLAHYGGSALRQADWAARLDTLNWAALERVPSGGFDRLPSESGPLQVLVSNLNVRFRAEVAGKSFDDAIRTAKTMLAISRHLGEHPTEVGGRLGLWAASLTLTTIEEMVQQPGCPNLYWALTELPNPLVELRKAVQGQRMFVDAELRPLRDDAPMTDTELESFVSRLSGELNFALEQSGRLPGNIRTCLRDQVNNSERVSAARARLIEAGAAKDRINTFPPLQAILLDAKRDFELARDERIKLLALPLWQAGASTDHTAGDRGVFADLLPDVNKLRLAQARLQQRIAALRLVEALRNHAAEHGGALPGEIRALSVPVPIDPISDKPFVYSLEAATAHIRGGSIQIAGRELPHTVHYEVTVATKSNTHP